MKKLKILFILPICALFSCSEDDGAITNYDLGANVVLNTSSLSNLDEDHIMEFSILTADDVSVSGVAVSKGENTTDATISGDIATFNSSLLGTLNGQEEDGIDITAVTTLSNGLPYSKDFNVAITKALSLEKGLEAITYNSSVEDTLTFAASTKSAIIDNISLEWKNGKEGTYAPTTPLGEALDVDGNEIIFANFTDESYGYNLAVKDTLYYRFIATSGSLTDTLETFIPIISQTFEAANSVSLSSDLSINKLSLDTATFYGDTNTEDGEIKFQNPAGFEKEGDTDIDFVKVGDLSGENEHYNTVDKLFSEKDLLVAQRLYEAGTAETGFNEVKKGDLYIYKITRATEDEEEVTKYGMIKIGDVITTNGGTTQTDISIEYGEAEIK
ncbi:hypothetical protein ZORO111903_10585 [Zobellia roscoffensis]|uniref:hypothetical protein n=1 Tax=Zobellia roscoffensis TaxID=2779508 RepID=UPI00188C795D|nr:hypothetical protein [Zobellia roscoffensis]